MKARWFAHPVKSLLVAACWLLLRQSLALPDLITATVLGVALPRLVYGFLGHDPAPRRWGRALRFAGLVLWDIVVSNFVVARIVLSPWSQPQPAWVEVPYTLQHPGAVTLLAAIVTMTPGTVSCVVDEARRVLVVHVLDGAEPAAVQAQIHARYALALKEIFE
ncbi:MAG: Na+/H+ antiporter subunit E [Rubrivivax sp.]|nr:Na+/H+ antiporter subunit E [Rubrivivax sp.]